MKVSISSIPLVELEVDALVVPMTQEEGRERTGSLAEAVGFTQAVGEDFKGKHGECLVVYGSKARARRVLLLGLGETGKLSPERLRRAMAAAAAPVLDRRVETLGLAVPNSEIDLEEATQAMVEGFLLAAYRYERYKTRPADSAGPQRLVLQTAEGDTRLRRALNRARIVAEATNFARDLVNRSPDEKTATDLARLAERSAQKYNYFAEVWDKARIVEEKMGGLLAVNRGSVEPPTFTVLEWRPENAVNQRPVILVGKGVVFDTGGLSLKQTAGSMDHMKADMSGAAAVIGAMEAVARLELPVYVMALIPATDNRPSDNAYVPGEVIRMHSGATVEVLNTDAEGRLILADALSFAKVFRPELVIDVATLTGAQVVALGSLTAALYANGAAAKAKLPERMVEAGEKTGDFVALMPLSEDYAELIESDIADLKNTGGREAGSITAAKFLEHFVDYPWMHIDIAGPAFIDSPKHYRVKGGTGFGVRLLVEFLRGWKG